jgi:hypothetical protein
VTRDCVDITVQTVRHDVTQPLEAYIEVEADGSGRATRLVSALLHAIGKRIEQGLHLGCRRSLAPKRCVDELDDGVCVLVERLGRDLLFAAREEIVDRSLGCAALTDDLVDPGARQACPPHQGYRCPKQLEPRAGGFMRRLTH